MRKNQGVPCWVIAVIALGACAKDRPAAECPPQESVTLPAPHAEAASDEVDAPKESRPAAPDGFVEVSVVTVVQTEAGAAVLLAEQKHTDDTLVLPIFVGGTEALSIHLRHNKEEYKRPLTHDLLDSSLAKLGGSVVKVHVSRLDGTTFIGAIFIRRGTQTFEIDARPSDAIALALGADVPIFVAKTVLEAAGVTKKELLEAPERRKPGDPTML